MMSASVLDTDSAADALISVVSRFALNALLDSEQRRQHKELCAERLAAQDNVEVQYAEQAVLANLDWGIDALEEAILTSNEETKGARLQHAEKMLQVSALLDSRHTTAGVPNSYLSAWAHLNLALVWQLRENDQNAAAHILEMFLVEPLYSRVDFAPNLWEQLFLPHLTSIVAWYTEQRHLILSSILPDSDEFSFSRDDASFNVSEYKNFLPSVSPEQAAQLQQLEQLYQDSLDENTRLYARYYKDCINFDPAVNAKRSMPLMPIAEPPMTPMHELSHIPQWVKFGPQPPTSAGFSYSNFGDLSMGYKNNGQPAASTYNECKSKQDVQKSTHKHQNPIWEEEHEPVADTYEDSESTNQDVYKQHFRQRSRGSLYNVNIDIDSLPSSNLNGVPMEEKTPSLVNNQSVSGQVSRHHNPPQAQSGSSKPLVALFQDHDTVVSSAQPFSSEEEYSSSLESDIVAQETHQEDTDFDEGGVTNARVYGRSRQEGNKTNIEATEPKDNDVEVHERKKERQNWESEDKQRSPVEISYATTTDVKDSGQNLSMLNLPDISTPVTRPPKDFVCPITSQIFNDPVTLETGQTYERRAIREWLDRGNTTCPITRQTLRSTSLPKTNYVLKRVIAGWKEQHPELALEFGSSENSPCLPRPPHSYSVSTLPFDQTLPEAIGSPDSLNSTSSSDSTITARRRPHTNGRSAAVFPSTRNAISQDYLQDLVNELKPAVDCICDSDDLQECESAVLTISQIWQESKGNQAIQLQLSKEDVVKGFMEVLSTSDITDVLAAATYILSELIERDKSVAQTIGQEDPDCDSFIGLLKRGVVPVTVLLYQLWPTSSQSAFSDLLPLLISVLKQCEIDYSPSEEPFPMHIGPKEAANLLIDQMFTAADHDTKSAYVHTILTMDGLSPLVDSLEATNLEERISAVSILLCCMQVDGSCRNYVAHRAQLTPVLELLHSSSERGQMITIAFLSELVRLNRRSINNQLLQVIKEEGSLSTMHVLLVHLQRVPHEHRPLVAGLLLQLDLLVPPRKGSMYREEAIEVLIEALANKDNIVTSVAAAETLVCLGGQFSFTGKPLMELCLLKSVGLDQGYNALMRSENQSQLEGDLQVNKDEEERAAKEWERRVAGAIVNFETGLIFEALGRGMKSQNLALSKACTIAVTWLVHMLLVLPDTGVLERASKALISEYIRKLKLSKETEDKAFAVISLNSFLNDPEGLQELVQCAKDICGPLRQLKGSLPMAKEILKKLISSPLVNAPELWTHEDLGPSIDVNANGEIRCLAHAGGRLFSGHSDGTLKVWDSRKKILSLIQDIKEHQKSVTCLYVSAAGDQLFSGSLDKTIRVWAIGAEEIHCVKSYDTKEPVQSLSVNSAVFCFGAPQSTGVRILQGATGIKTLPLNKHVQSIAMAEGKLFCGCTDNSIQDVDMAGGPPIVIQQGVRTLLGKKSIYGLQIFDGKLYSAGSSVDGMAAKVWSLKDRTLIGQLAATSDVRAMFVNDEFIYLGSTTGHIEVWLRERLVKVAGMNIGSKVTSLLAHDGVLVSGSDDGRIRRWTVSG